MNSHRCLIKTVSALLLPIGMSLALVACDSAHRPTPEEIAAQQKADDLFQSTMAEYEQKNIETTYRIVSMTHDHSTAEEWIHCKTHPPQHPVHEAQCKKLLDQIDRELADDADRQKRKDDSW